MFSAKDLFFASQGGYRISNSLRFRSSASAYLNRTFGTATNNRIFTWSGWVKIGTIPATREGIFVATNGAGSVYFGLEFNASAQLNLYDTNVGGATIALTTTQVFRDPSSWYHIVLAVDTTQATASNRNKLYVNGVQVTTFSTAVYSPLNSSPYMNSAVAHSIGSWQPAASTLYFDGYMAEVNFIDGQALDASAFGQTDAATGVWQPKKYTGTYGTNGFYLNFSDNSGATATTIGKDSSGNGNNWTPNNISVTSGVTYDSMVDTPTNFDNGGNGAGNYAVINPLDSFATGGVTISGANLNVSLDRTTYDNWARASFVVPSSGKWYFEWTPTAVNTGTIPYFNAGVIAANTLRSTQWTSATFRAMRVHDGQKQTSSTVSTYGGSTSTIPGTDYFMCAIDMDAGSIYFGKNGNWANGTGSFNQTFSTAAAAFTDLISAGVTWMPFVYHGGQTTNTGSINFGQRPFGATPPSGYLALNTQNLTTPTILAGNKYMDVSLYTGTGASQSITNSGSFQPDFLWTKSRSIAASHILVDAVRTVSQELSSNDTTAETTNSGRITSFNSNGWSLGATSAASLNQSSATYVGWQWKANGSGSSNTSGTITSTVSANTTAGFSIVTYTGTGANATVGHGLGVAPSMIIIFERSPGGDDHIVYHSSLTSNQYSIRLNTTAAQAGPSANYWNSTSPTSAVFSVGVSGESNQNTATYVAYCFAPVAGYSAFGRYTGNGSADGPFVYLGFRPKYIMVKNATTGGAGYDWCIWDTSRATYNVIGSTLVANLSDAEFSAANIDILSNGFKMRTTSNVVNGSGNTIIYAAFAENPFKISRAR